MTWEEKFAAINRLAPASLVMSKPGRWRVSQPDVELMLGSMLRYVNGRGTTPQQAIENHWDRLTILQPFQCIVVDSYKNTRRTVVWHGSTWEDRQMYGRSVS